MMTHARLTPILALVLGLGGAATADESYVRFQTGATREDGALQCAVAHFKAPGKDVEVILYGVVHIADAEYYARVQQDLDSHTVVLFEGVAPGKEGVKEDMKDLGDMQGFMGQMLGLSFQKDGINYTRKNLVHADMNMDELKEANGGEDFNPMGALMGDQMKAVAPFMRMLAGAGKQLFEKNPEMAEMMKGQMKGVKMMMARQMSGAGPEMMAQMGGEKAKKAMELILFKRNEVVMKRLKEQLEKVQTGTISIFYGAAHMPDLEAKLGEIGFKQTSKRWMTAWKIGNGAGDEGETPAQEPAATPTTPPSPKGPRWF